MYGPRALVSMAAVLVVFAGATYFRTASSFTTLWQTALCAVILQLGYFACVVFLVRREQVDRQKNLGDAASQPRGPEAVRGDDLHANPASKLHIGDRS
ncbi:exopolysaccharide production repressor protein [Rhizobium helianthi]